MVADVIMQGDVGREFLVDMGFDCTTYPSARILIKKPSKIVTEVAATIVGNFIQYFTVDGDLDEVGLYKLYAQVEGQITKRHFEIVVREVPEVTPP
jgi:hypothetical protein